jgi:hypothetical protein
MEPSIRPQRVSRVRRPSSEWRRQTARARKRQMERERERGRTRQRHSSLSAVEPYDEGHFWSAQRDYHHQDHCCVVVLLLSPRASIWLDGHESALVVACGCLPVRWCRPCALLAVLAVVLARAPRRGTDARAKTLCARAAGRCRWWAAQCELASRSARASAAVRSSARTWRAPRATWPLWSPCCVVKRAIEQTFFFLFEGFY